MDEKDKQSALDKLSGTGVAGGLGGAALLAGLGAAARYSSRLGEEHSILSNPILLGALGAGLGYAGGTALDNIKPDPLAKETWSPGWGTGGLLAGGGLYTIGASAAKKNADEVIGSLVKTRKLTSADIKKLTPKELNKLITSLALRGRIVSDIVNSDLQRLAKNVGVEHKGLMRNFLRYNAFSPRQALVRGLFYDAPVRLGTAAKGIYGKVQPHLTTIQQHMNKPSILNALKQLKQHMNKQSILKLLGGSIGTTKSSLKTIGRTVPKAAPVVAALAGLGILGKKLLSDNED